MICPRSRMRRSLPAGRQRILRVFSSTVARSSSPVGLNQLRCSHAWQDVNSTGVPSVSVSARLVTRGLPQTWQLAPWRAPGWVSDPRATGATVRVRADRRVLRGFALVVVGVVVVEVAVAGLLAVAVLG